MVSPQVHQETLLESDPMELDIADTSTACPDDGAEAVAVRACMLLE